MSQFARGPWCGNPSPNALAGERRKRFDLCKESKTPFVVTIRKIEERDQRPGIHQDHRGCFLRIRCAKAALASRAGAPASPPRPRASSRLMS